MLLAVCLLARHLHWWAHPPCCCHYHSLHHSLPHSLHHCPCWYSCHLCWRQDSTTLAFWGGLKTSGFPSILQTVSARGRLPREVSILRGWEATGLSTSPCEAATVGLHRSYHLSYSNKVPFDGHSYQFIPFENADEHRYELVHKYGHELLCKYRWEFVLAKCKLLL